MFLKVLVRHYHGYNDPDGSIRRKLQQALAERLGQMLPPNPCELKYATEARLVDIESGRELDWDVSFCSARDNPSRRLGRAIAVGRLIKRHPDYDPTAVPTKH